MSEPTRGELERIARLSHGRLVALLAARSGSVSAAADALSEALLAALETWPRTGLPERPEAWLMTVARRRLIDRGRHGRVVDEAAIDLALLHEESAAAENGRPRDRLLDLMFVCAHPAIDARMRTPLMLQLVLGLDAGRMAAAFLLPPATLGRRLTRARAKIEAARIPFEVPEPEARGERIGHVLDAVYAAYTVGAERTPSGDAKASALAHEALWLASVAASGLPGEGEAQALLALILYVEARRPARVDAGGGLVPITRQEIRLWDARLLADADLALRLARSARSIGPYQLEAAIQAAHCARRTGGTTDWAAIAALHEGLARLYPSAGSLTGWAAALLEAGDVAAATSVLDRIPAARADPYQPWWAVRAHVLAAAGDREGASAAFERAIALSLDPAQRRYLEARRAAL